MILDFDKPMKVRSSKEHNDYYSADSAPPGVYVPNMSKEDMYKWKAKKIGGSDPRIEVRKTSSAQMLFIVRPSGSVIMSSNGKMEFSSKDWNEMQDAIQEAIAELNK